MENVVIYPMRPVSLKLLDFENERKDSQGHQVKKKKNQISCKDKIIRPASNFLEKHI